MLISKQKKDLKATCHPSSNKEQPEHYDLMTEAGFHRDIPRDQRITPVMAHSILVYLTLIHFGERMDFPFCGFKKFF